MTNVSEIKEIFQNSIQARKEEGRKRAFQTLDNIDPIIRAAAENCESYINVSVWQAFPPMTAETSHAYITTLLAEIRNNGYTAEWSPSRGILRIAWN